MSSNIHLKERAISLRKKGYSYNKIIKKLGLKSKGTLSAWFKDVHLSEETKKLLSNNNIMAHKRGLLTANSNRTIRIGQENKDSFDQGRKLVGSLKSKELVLIGAALYWAEETKSEKRVSLSLVFSNSDPRMISVYMRFVREILKVNDIKIRAGIHLYPSTSITNARQFWSEVTGLPEDRFYIVTQVSKASKNKRPINILPHGTAVIKINNRVQFYKVKGMMSGIIERLKG